MRFRVRHVTTYTYSEPVRLGPHWLRLRPRCDGAGELVRFRLDVDPPPTGRTDSLDADGNLVTRVRFDGETERLTVRSEFELRTAHADPPDVHAEPMPWPEPYAPALRHRLMPWLAHGEVDPAVRHWAAALRQGTERAADYPQRLNERLHLEIDRQIRDLGAPQPPEETLRVRRGACRDLAVLFAAACRSQGLAARFVSGY